MLAALGVREIGAVVLVDGEAEPAFERAEVVAEDVGVFVEVDGLEREFAEAFAAVGIRGGVGSYAAAAEFGACAVLVDEARKVPRLVVCELEEEEEEKEGKYIYLDVLLWFGWKAGR